ncbi:Amidase signature domain [Trinorchestia longiramus]|nr:Amidase signature domain [Trinorchestia longiramus]
MNKFTETQYKEHRHKAEGARLALEQDLISTGGEGVLLTKERDAVLALRPIDLLQQLRGGQLSAVTVLQAYQAKAIQLSRRTNCITEFIPDALERAQALDSFECEQRKPLHGLPVSVKDNIAVQGMDTTLGLLKRVNNPEQDDADVIKIIKKLGAIPFVKTNLSQIALTPGCSNPLWGETIHPLNPQRSSGGSSGGEGALIAGGGSVFGLGSDIAGSVRLPSNWCGIVGLKPTSTRISNRGVTNIPGPIGIFGTVGMLFEDAEICNEVTKAIFSENFHEHKADVPPLPWNDALHLSRKPLRIGVLDSSLLFPVTPGVQRALDEASSAFIKLGFEVVPYSLPSLTEGLDIYTQLIMGDKGELTTSLLEGEIVDDGLSWYREFATVLPHDVDAAKPKLRRLFGDLAVKHSLGTLETVSDLWKKMIDRSSFSDCFLKTWKASGLDLLMSPVSPCPAPQPQYIGKLTSGLVFTMLFNLLDYPSMAVPITWQSRQDDENIQHLKVTDYIHEVIKEIGSHAAGLPLGVQLTALPYSEEVLCRATAQLSQVVNYKLRP